jgi:hypothetical protein
VAATCFRGGRLTGGVHYLNSSVFRKFYPHTLNYYQPHMVNDTLRKTRLNPTFLCARSSVEVMQCSPERVALLVHYFTKARAIILTGSALI